MGAASMISVEQDGIGHILADKHLVVPAYQRDYKWDAEQVKQLYEDIARAIELNEASYFLGSIVVTQTRDNTLEVVDGQQRLATVAIFLAAVRDYLLTAGETDRADVISAGYLYDRDLATVELKPRIRLNELDNDYFQKHVLEPSANRPTETSERPSHRRIMGAAKIAREMVASLVRDKTEPVRHLVDWVDYLRSRALAILVTTSSEANAFVIFETLNDRGLALAVSDLLKNLLLREAGDRTAEVKERWTSMAAIIESSGQEDCVPFIRHSWSSRHGLTREKELYRAVADGVRTAQQAVDEVTKLGEDARVYAALLHGEHEFWGRYAVSTANCVRDLNLLGMVQMRPLLLALVDRFIPTEVDLSFQRLVSAAVRFTITGGLGSGSLERLFTDAASAVRNKEMATFDDLHRALLPKVPSDDEFEDAFSKARVSKAPLARYYLACLERQADEKKPSELIPNPDTDAVNLEHILPERPTTAWNVTQEDAADLYKRIGNLALLSTRINAEIGNQGFEAKMKHYAESGFALTRALTEFSSWGPLEIEQRQRALARLAVKAWPR